MVNIYFTRDLEFPADTVWALLQDFGNMKWAMGSNRVEVIGEGPGMTRRLFMEGMEPIDEVLETMDYTARTYSYTIPRGLPLPVKDYRAAARVETKPDGMARVHWSCECTPTDPSMSEADIEALMHSTYNGLLDMVSAHLGQQD